MNSVLNWWIALATAATGHGLVDDGMVLIDGGSFRMGAEYEEAWPAERPIHQVSLQSFWIDQHLVTVKEFAAFTKATGHKTESEKFGWSVAFDVRTHPWKRVERADRRSQQPRFPLRTQRHAGEQPKGRPALVA